MSYTGEVSTGNTYITLVPTGLYPFSEVYLQEGCTFIPKPASPPTLGGCVPPCPTSTAAARCRGCQVRRRLTGRAPCAIRHPAPRPLRLNISDKNRRYIGKSQSKRQPQKTPRPPHLRRQQRRRLIRHEEQLLRRQAEVRCDAMEGGLVGEAPHRWNRHVPQAAAAAAAASASAVRCRRCALAPTHDRCRGGGTLGNGSKRQDRKHLVHYRSHEVLLQCCQSLTAAYHAHTNTCVLIPRSLR
jgi:hypothetical protein